MKHRFRRWCSQKNKQCRYGSTLLFVFFVFASLHSFRVHGSQTEYEFSAPPILESGLPLEQGAVYRFEGVSADVDALVRIALINNAKVLRIDVKEQGISAALQPEIEVLSIGGFVDFEVTWVDSETQEPLPFSAAASVLGVSHSKDYDQFFSVSDFTVEADTSLNVSVVAPQTLYVGGGSSISSQVSVSNTGKAVTANIGNTDNMVYRVGSNRRTRRLASLLFLPLDFVDPTFANINDSPVAHDDLSVAGINRSLLVAAPGLLKNDSDIDLLIDSDILSITHFRVGGASYPAGSTAEIDAGHLTINDDGSYQFVPGPNISGEVQNITYIVEDGKGGSDEATLKILILLHDGETPSDPEVTIEEDANNDGWINAQELQGPVDVSFVLPASAIVGDRLKITDGKQEKTFEVDTVVLISGTIQSNFPAPIDGGTIQLEAIYLDTEGSQVLTSFDRAIVDILPTDSPEVAIIADLDDSGFLSLEEYVEQLDVGITLPATVSVNNRVEIRVGTRVNDVVLTPLDIANGRLSMRVDAPIEGSTLTVLVKIFDEAGNASDVASDSVVVDTVAPTPPSVDLLESASGTPVITGTAPLAGEYILSVTVNEVVYASGDGNLLDIGNGTWQLSIPLLDTLPTGEYDVHAALTDMAGNRSVDTTANELSVDLQVPQLSIINPGPISDPAPLIRGTTNLEDRHVVNVVTRGNIFVCSGAVKDAQWSCRSRILLGVGENMLLASVVDAVVNSAISKFSINVIAFSDEDGDGIPDDVDGASDADGDGIANYLDLDSDNDTIPDNLETAIDTDGDGTRNFLDLDSDNDSLSDLYESSFSRLVDKDRSGSIDASIIVGNNGLADVIETLKDSGDTPSPLDSDDDGLPDYIDRDSDNDGIEDVSEQGAILVSTINSELDWTNDTTEVELRDAVDTDVDGVADYLDLDSDQDGISDVFESLGTYSSSNGRIDQMVDVDKDGLVDTPSDADSQDIDLDGVPNQKDLDSDADGLSDLIESGGIDVDSDGIHDGWIDLNLNGVHDKVDQAYTRGADIDGDGLDDLYDVDLVNERDSDGDGIVDSADSDRNGDGRLDLLDDANLTVDSIGDRLPKMYEPNVETTISTSTGSFGCSLRSSSRVVSIDPTIVVMLLVAIVIPVRRRFFSLDSRRFVD